MSYGSIWGSVRNFVGIRTFADCEGHYTSTHTIRGYDKEEHGVPLRLDRVNHNRMRLMKLNDDTYACRLHQTNVVTFKRDGRIVVDLTYGSVSTREFASRFLPYTSGLSCYTLSGKEILSDRHGAYPAGYGTLELIQEAGAVQGRYVVNRAGLPTMGVKRVDRKKTKAPRDLIKPFCAYLKTIAALTANGMDKDTVHRMGFIAHGVSLEMLTLDDLQDEEFFPIMAASTIKEAWEAGNSQFGGVVYRVNEAAAIKRVADRAYTLMGAYYIEALPVGVVHRKMRSLYEN